jgi:hypothetical protein
VLKSLLYVLLSQEHTTPDATASLTLGDFFIPARIRTKLTNRSGMIASTLRAVPLKLSDINNDVAKNRAAFVRNRYSEKLEMVVDCTIIATIESGLESLRGKQRHEYTLANGWFYPGNNLGHISVEQSSPIVYGCQ